MRISGSLLIFLVILAGCATTPTPEEVLNADYGEVMQQADCEQSVVQTMNSYLKDPESAIYEFGECAKAWMPSVPSLGLKKQYGYRIDAQINAKHSFGEYAGSTGYIFLFNNGVVQRKLKPVDDGTYWPF